METSKLDIETFRAELEKLSERLTEISISTFQNHNCLDCGERLKKFGALRCPRCNMRRIGRRPKK